ncbi:uncharacterized protein TNCV_2283181 [Trichonephila clavipes]|uniref:Uncharacterized protein n=1 Tax=Trichonephila clavipes TaxID=2585209 RepID=A0A8X6RG43_TRICX|nr:uncharacterized protein TNCV_2283181 [Trichonephila clavipes]
MVSWEYLWPTLRCRREAGVSPLLSIGWWYLSTVTPKRHCCRVSAADKGCRVYPLDPCPDAVVLYSGCTPGLVLPTLNIDTASAHIRILLISLPNNDMSKISPFAIHKTLIGIGGEPKSVKRLRSGNLLIETTSALQTKSFLLAKSFLNNPVTVSPHKSLNSCRGVISQPDLLDTPDSEILEGFSDQGVTQSHPSDSKLCQKWKLEKQIQEIKTSKSISYFEALKLIVPQLTQTYAQTIKHSTISTTTQTDPNITNRICPPLQCLKLVSSKNPMPSTSSSVSTVSTSSSSTQENLLPSPSAIIPTIQSESLLKIPIPTTTTTNSPGNNLNTSVSSLETKTRSLTIPDKFNELSTENLPESVPTTSNIVNILMQLKSHSL